MIKKILLISVNFIAILPFIIFFNHGVYVAIYMVPVIFILSLINTLLSQGIKDFLIKNLFLGISNIAGILINSLLYFVFICYDGAGVAVMLAEVSIAFIYVVILSIIGLIIKSFILKLRNK